MSWWSMDKRQVGQALKTSLENGLSTEEAGKRLLKNGENVLSQKSDKKSLLRRFVAQLNDFMIILLLGAAVISFAVSYFSGENDFFDSVIIIAIVILNALLGVFQESKAEKALEALKKISAPKAVVLRDGKREEIPAPHVVVGDVLILEAGGYISADSRIFKSDGLKTEESAITGESMAIEKESGALPENTVLGDRKNMVLSGSYVLSGSGLAIAVATGMATEIGRIAHLLEEQEEQETPLQGKLAETGKTLGIGALIVCGIIFIMGLLRSQPPFTMFMTSVSLAVAAIPEGLPAIVTIVLAIGMQRMSRKNAIIRRLPAVETLGSAEIICSDKTGTLTQNRMRVVKLADQSTILSREKRRLILTMLALCNNSRRENGRLSGDPTERALIEAAENEGVSLKALTEEMPRCGEIPFSSERKCMTTLHSLGDGQWITVTKGAPDIILEKCSQCIDGHSHTPFTDGRKNRAFMENGKMASRALRVVAVAYREWDKIPDISKADNIEDKLIFAGLAAMADPARPEAAEAVRLCKRAGICPVMITGDHRLTAEAIAKELGIFNNGDVILTGQEIEEMSQYELQMRVKSCTVFARVAPEHKVRIVKAFQQNGSVVAMTGDGVNDAPALKAADIGCAMGKSGTEVAKGAADMILTDDNFATIVEAVREGRGIYDNIRKSVHFLLSSNIGEIITIFIAMCFGWATPLLPIQLLWVNLVTDSLPAIALGLEPVEKGCMERPPRKKELTLFGDGLWGSIITEGIMIGMLALLAFGIGHIYFDSGEAHIIGRTMAFAVLSLSQLVHAFNMRSDRSLFSLSLFENRWLCAAFVVGIALQTGVIMLPPLAGIFQVVALDSLQWGIVIFLSLTPLPIVELEKLKNNSKKRGLFSLAPSKRL